MESEPFDGRRPHYRLMGIQRDIKEWCDSVYQEKADGWKGGEEEWP